MSDAPDDDDGRRPADLPYATPATGRAEGGGWFGLVGLVGLVPLVSGFGLLALGLQTMYASIPGGDPDYRLQDTIEILTFALFTVGLLLAVAGAFLVFRALRKYDW